MNKSNYETALYITILAAEEHLKGQKKSKWDYDDGCLASRKQLKGRGAGNRNPARSFLRLSTKHTLMNTIPVVTGSFLKDKGVSSIEFVLSDLAPKLAPVFTNGVPADHATLQELRQGFPPSQAARHICTLLMIIATLVKLSTSSEPFETTPNTKRT